MRKLLFLCLLAAFSTPVFGQASAAITPIPRPQFFSAAGAPLSGGSIKTYQAGTNTRLATYADYQGMTLNGTTITLDAGGFPQASGGGPTNIFLQANTYKFCAYNALSALEWCVDGVSDIGQLLKANLAASAGSALVGFLQAGANALTNETMQDKMRQVISAADFAGSDMGQKINRAIASCSTCLVQIPAGSYSYSTPIVAPSGTFLAGAGREATKLTYSPITATKAVSTTGTAHVTFRDFSVVGSGSSTCLSIVTASEVLVESVMLDGCSVGYEVSGTDTAPSADVFMSRSEVRNYTSIGWKLDHTIGGKVSDTTFFAVPNNPTHAWGIVADTGTSGVQGSNIDVGFAGMIVRNTMPTANTYGGPPVYTSFTALTLDTCYSDCLKFDATLNTPSGPNNVTGNSYTFTDLWTAFCQVVGCVGIRQDGGSGVVINGLRDRVNLYHGILLTGGSGFRATNVNICGNNFGDTNVDGDGVHVNANINDFSIIGGVISNVSAKCGDLGGGQHYGVRIATGTSAGWRLAHLDVTGNASGGWSDGSTTDTLADIYDVCDTGAGSCVTSGRGRFSVGDSSFFLDTRIFGTNAPILNWGSGAFDLYSRTSLYRQFYINSQLVMQLSQLGVSTPAPISTPQIVAGQGGGATTTYNNLTGSLGSGVVIFTVASTAGIVSGQVGTMGGGVCVNNTNYAGAYAINIFNATTYYITPTGVEPTGCGANVPGTLTISVAGGQPSIFYSGVQHGSATGPIDFSGSGAPSATGADATNCATSVPLGSTYRRTDSHGAGSTYFYVCEGSGANGVWTAK